MQASLVSFFFSLLFFAIHGVAEPAQRSGPSSRDATVKGEVKESLIELEAKISDAEQRNDWRQAARLYDQLSALARTGGQLQKAISYGKKSLEIAQRIKDPQLQAHAHLQLSRAFSRVGQETTSMELLERGVEIAKQIPAGFNMEKEQVEGSLHTMLGVGLLRHGKTAGAIDHIFYALQALESRLAFLRRGSRVFHRGIQNAQADVVLTLEKLGSAYEQAGNRQEAIRAYERGVSMTRQSELKRDGATRTRIYEALGRLYLSDRDFPRALENSQSALRLAEELKYANGIQAANRQLGNIFLQTDRSSEAIPYFRKAIDSIESTRSQLESEEFRTSFFEDKGQTYGGIILAHLGAKNVEEAFNYNERARSRAFLDILGSKVQLASQGALLQEERELQAKISLLKARTGAEAEEGEEGGGGQLSQELEAAHNAYNEFLSKVRKENKEQASLMNVEPLTLNQLHGLLDPGVTVLEYFVLRGRAVLWVVDKDRVNFVRLSLNRDELISKVTALREGINQVEEKDKFKQASEELYRVLIEPALPYINGKELLIIPHDALHYLPFQALLSPQGRYLIQDYPINYLSSASLMQFTKEKKRASREKALVMGNPSLGDPAYNLRFAEREAREVAQIYPKSAVYLKDEASKPKAISLSPNFEMLHFAGCGVQ